MVHKNTLNFLVELGDNDCWHSLGFSTIGIFIVFVVWLKHTQVKDIMNFQLGRELYLVGGSSNTLRNQKGPSYRLTNPL